LFTAGFAIVVEDHNGPRPSAEAILTAGARGERNGEGELGPWIILPTFL